MSRISGLIPFLLIASLTSCSEADRSEHHASSDEPVAWQSSAQALTAVETLKVTPPDFAALEAEEAKRLVPGPYRFAVSREVDVSPEKQGTWEKVGAQQQLWRLRISSPGALSLNLGFTTCDLPQSARLSFYSADKSHAVSRPLVAADCAAAQGELWTPVVLADDVVVELVVDQSERDLVDLHLTSVNPGFRKFGPAPLDKQGTCNIDTVCPEGDDWRDEIPSVGMYSINGTNSCTGAMVNNTADDETPYFLTADHCGVTASNDNTVVVYWNYESPSCGQLAGGSLSDFQAGSVFRADYAPSDFTLIELASMPDPAHQVTYAGWTRDSGDFSGAIAVHHPNTDEKAISFENQAVTTTSYFSDTSPGDGTHIRVDDWDLGTTEPGSSGSPLFSPEHRIIGQLHGGLAACGNDEPDWYGRFSVSWDGGGSDDTRLSNWLDPSGSGASAVDTLVPWNTSLAVAPHASFDATGDVGGPFTPASTTYTLTNNSAGAIDVAVSLSATWLQVDANSFTLGAGASRDITLSHTPDAFSLPQGMYSAVIDIENLTDGAGTAARDASLVVGVPSPLYTFPLDSDPGWTTEGEWAFGVPQGGGGSVGNPDPTAGHTGPNVYGYNLDGDYARRLGTMHLTSEAIDLTDAFSTSVSFWRWLNVQDGQNDNASFSVSNDGSNWTVIWRNPTGSNITDSSWTEQSYDISAVADGQATVYLRWTMGATDRWNHFSGWNIDDITVFGIGATCADSDNDGVCDPVDACPGFDDNEDADNDSVPDGCDVCPGFDDNVDADNDLVPDACDVCPGHDDGQDTDGDAVPDGCDVCSGHDDNLDTDGDSVPDGCDVCPGFDDSGADTDGDGVVDGCDTCPGHDDFADDDSDSVADGCDLCPNNDDRQDTDGDGVPDGCDFCPGHNDALDTDGDGVPDGCDLCPGHDDGGLDTDGDGVVDPCDACPGFDDGQDADGDGLADGCDMCPGHDDGLDADGDSVADGCDVCPGYDDGVDTDGDSVADGCDLCPGHDDGGLDTDGDGVVDPCDACPGFDDGQDADGDGVADGCDACPGHDDGADSDGDAVPDACDACFGYDDNLDTDGDGVADGCDLCPGHDDGGLDTDGDGVIDPCDACPGHNDGLDTDGDGVADGCDVCAGHDDGVDSDGDSVADGCDVCAGHDDNLDTDGDSVADGCDACPGHDDGLDTDGDSVPEGCDACPGFDDGADDDGDGVADGCDVCAGFDDGLDEDGDSVADGCDGCPGHDDGLDEDGDSVADGCDVCPGHDDGGEDSDGDGVVDPCDDCSGHDDNLDEDGDSVADGCDVCLGHDDALDDDSDGVPDGCDGCPGHDDGLDDDADSVPDGCDVCSGHDDALDDDSDGVPDGCDVCAGHDDGLDSDSDGVADGCDVCPADSADDSDGDGVCDSDDLCEGHDDSLDADEDGIPDGCEESAVSTASGCGCGPSSEPVEPLAGGLLLLALAALVRRRRVAIKVGK